MIMGISRLLLGGGGWWWIYFGCRSEVVDGGGYILGSGG